MTSVAAAQASTNVPEHGTPTSVVIHSYDVGVRHLAQAILRLTRDASQPRGVRTEVIAWQILDVATAAGARDVNYNTASIDSITKICAVGWGRLRHELFRPEDEAWPDHVFIELQPATLNNKMQVVSYLLQLFLLSHYGVDDRRPAPSFEFVSAELKLREADFSEFFAGNNASLARSETRRLTKRERQQDRDKKYELNKAFAKKQTPVVLAESGCPERAEWFRTQGGKRDDLADAMLMGFYRGSDILMPWTTRASASASKTPAHPKKRARSAPPKGSKKPESAPRRAKRTTQSLEAQLHPEMRPKPA